MKRFLTGSIVVFAVLSVASITEARKKTAMVPNGTSLIGAVITAPAVSGILLAGS